MHLQQAAFLRVFLEEGRHTDFITLLHMQGHRWWRRFLQGVTEDPGDSFPQPLPGPTWELSLAGQTPV